MKITYTSTCQYSGRDFRYSVECASWRDEPYPPGGTLRVFYDAAGKLAGGTLLEELSEFKEIES